jgi:CHAT domain-containing protein
MGDLRNAEKYYLTILPVYQDLIRNKDISERNVAYARLLNNLGILYNEMGNYSESEKYFLEALKCKQEVFGGDHSEYAATLNNLGAIYRNIKDYPKAEKYYQDALNIIENKYGKNHSGYAISINNLGSLYTNMGNYEKAEKYLSEANDICMNVLGESHPNTSISISNMAVLYQSLDNHDKTVLFKAKACGIKQNSIEKNFTFLSENQRNLYWNKATSEFESSYSVSWIYPNKESNILNYNNTLFTKGLLLRTNNGIRDAIYVSGNSQLIGQYEQLGNLRKEISILQQKPDFNKEYAQTLEARADSLDKAVTQASAAFRDLKADIAMTWQDVQKQLKKDEAAIEFVHFRLYDKHWTDTTMYAALVLRHGMTAPAWIPLCEQKQLQSALQTESKDVQQQTEMQYIEKGKELYRQAWSPLDKELAGVKTVYYSPSGLLHKIAFNALPTDKPTILLSDKYNLKLVSSTREIARLKKETAGKPAQDTTVVYGGLTYDMNQASMLASARKYRQEDSLLSDNSSRRIDRIRRRRDAELPDSTLRSGFSSWQYLKGTKSETEEIVSSLEQKNIPHEYLTETRGNEESFKHLSGTKTGVIHLATHGFFLPDIENKAVENIVQLLGGNKEKPFENPLLRSGLIMSGANNQWAAKESVMEDGIEDGILTADEIARLNLTRTELVVLSACETGLGDVKNSEGVFGLQRAFKLAGVKSLIMSLWKVPDEATAELMTAFYHGWLNGKTKQEAFKTAQMQVREKYKSPYYWAAFVMMD